jgi:hypothetical protein
MKDKNEKQVMLRGVHYWSERVKEDSREIEYV